MGYVTAMSSKQGKGLKKHQTSAFVINNVNQS